MASGPKFPSTFVAGLLLLHNLDDKTFDALFAKLSSSRPTLNIDDITSTVRLVNDIPDAEDLARTLVSIGGTADEVGLELVLSTLAESIKSTDEFKSFSPEDAKVLLSRLKSLITGESGIRKFLKANRVIHSHQQIFSECKILTDLRPVFNEIGDEPIAAGIIHNLKIEYKRNDESLEFYVVLDDRDVRALQEQLNRAIIKSKSLQKVLTSSGITCLTPQPEQNESV